MDKHSRKSLRYIFGMNSIFLGNNYLWISFESLFLPYLIELILPVNLQSIYLGVIAFSGIILGILFNLLSGIITDNFQSKIGRRRPMILLGSIITLISLLLFITIKISFILVVSVYILIEIGSNIAYGSYLPLIRDVIPDYQRGASSGISGFFTLVGTAAGFGISGLLLGINQLIPAVIVIIVAIAISTATTVNTIKGEDVRTNADRFLKHFSRIFKKITNVKRFKWMFISNFFIILGSSGLTFFEFYYFRYVLDLKDSAIYVAIAGLVILAISAVSTVFIGILSDKIGKEIFILVFPLIGGISIFMIAYINNFYTFLVLGSLIGISFGNYFSLSNSFISYIVPGGNPGKFMALFSMSTGLGSAISPLIYGLILFLLKNQSRVAYGKLFEISSIFFFIGFILIFFRVVNARNILKKQM